MSEKIDSFFLTTSLEEIRVELTNTNTWLKDYALWTYLLSTLALGPIQLTPFHKIKFKIKINNNVLKIVINGSLEFSEYILWIKITALKTIYNSRH
jgi:hypothetical protein